jgi:protein-disulfide isomerase
MSKTSSFIAILIAAVGGFIVGHMTGKAGPGGDDDSAAVVDDEQGGLGAPGAAVAEAGEHPRFRVPVTAAQPSKGPADALVTIVEFSEFECPFCSRVLPTTEQLLKDYAGKVRVVWRNNPLPFHNNAMPAAQLAMEAFEQGGSEKFWQIHDVLFANQRQLTRENLERFAKEAGLDVAKVKQALDSGKHQASIKADQDLAAQIGARGTPNFFINGRQLVGAQPVEAFKAVVDDEIQRAEALVKKGTAKKDVYATLLRAGQVGAGAPQQPSGDRPAAPSQPDPKAVYKVELAGNEPQKGPNDALVTIVEVSDFQCPFCGRVNPTLKQVQDEYGKDVRIVWWNNPLPFHKEAGPAATVALEAHAQGGNAKFWEMHDKLFERQREINRENLELWAKELGLNAAKVKEALDKGKYDEVIKAQQQKAAQLGARGTPAFFINGRFVSGAQPYPAFKTVIDEELARAKKIVEGGTPRARVYAEAIKDGKTSPVMVGGGAAPGQPAAPPANQRYNIAIPPGAPSVGPANAPIVIQEFSDYQCPFCSRVLPTLDQILETYKGKVRLVWRDLPLPFHNEASPAAQAAREVLRQGGNDKFWKYNKMLFDNQRALGRAKYEELAEQIGGINMVEFRKALDTERHKAAVDADMNAAQQSGARIGTPAFFINGRLVSGAQPFEAFKAVIDEELAKK